MERVLALTNDGRMTYCTCQPEQRGKGRCNHIAHQNENEGVQEFLDRVSEQIRVDGEKPSSGAGDEDWGEFRYDMELHKQAVAAMPDNSLLLQNLVHEYGIAAKNPDWECVFGDIKNPFCVGSVVDGTYEEAELLGVDQHLLEYGSDGNVFHLTAHYMFRGKMYDLDLGEVPAVGEDGVITINGGRWRVLPVLEQHNAGVISYPNNVVICQDDGNLAITIPKDPDVDYVLIRGRKVAIEDVQEYWKTGIWDETKLTSGQRWSIDHLDPDALRRFPDLKENLSAMKGLHEDEIGDISNRRVIRYEDMVKNIWQLQARRMGVTFRTNLQRQMDAVEAGALSPEEADEKFPLFYQKNLTDNIKRDLISRSNVQTAESLNPISALAQAQKISLTGPGGWNKDKAPYELRMPHPTHEGLIDPLVASSGKNVGLTACMTGGHVGEDRFIHKKLDGEPSLSPSDFIPYKHHDDPSRANMACSHLVQACPIVGGEDPIISTPAWDKIKGAKLGLNLRTSYVSDKGAFEDAVVLSESAAGKMATVQSQEYRCYDQGALKGLKVGQRLERKMRVGNTEIKYGGVVKSISDESFEVETVFPMTVGDKLSNRHGGKSTVSEIRKDKDMPQIFDETTGKFVPSEIIMTPLGVVGRKNLGQVMECNEAAEITGMHLHRDGEKPTDINRSGTMVSGGKKVEGTCGVEYVMRLNHIAEKKLQSHADEVERDGFFSGTRLGEMDAILLSTDKDRLKVLNYLRHQEAAEAHNKLKSLLHSIGVDMDGVNW